MLDFSLHYSIFVSYVPVLNPCLLLRFSAGEKKEEKEDVDVPTITTATSVDDNDVVESRL